MELPWLLISEKMENMTFLFSRRQMKDAGVFKPIAINGDQFCKMQKIYRKKKNYKIFDNIKIRQLISSHAGNIIPVTTYITNVAFSVTKCIFIYIPNALCTLRLQQVQ